MKKLILLLSVFVIACGADAQSEEKASNNTTAKKDSKIKWKVAAKRTSATTAEIYFKATLAKTWHIWSLNPGDEMLIAPEFTYDNKGVKAYGKSREIGKKISKKEEGFDNELNYFEGTVVYVQKVNIGNAKKISGSIYYQICDPKRCLPPADKKFTVSIK